MEHTNAAKKLPVKFVSSNPPIVRSSWYDRGLDDIEHVGHLLAEIPLLILMNNSWSIADRMIKGSLDGFCQQVHSYSRRHPRHRILLLANDQHEKTIFDEYGLDTIVCNHNAFIDETLYRPVPVVKEFDAIYNARLFWYKRPQLAKDISKLCIVYDAVEDDYLPHVESSLAAAYFPNGSPGGPYRSIGASELSELYSKSVCGLALSAFEGGMKVLVEYLLSGIPVVTTPSLGGRSTFYTEGAVHICSPTPEAVLEKVEQLRATPIRPMEIRLKTIATMVKYRACLLEKAASLLLDVGIPGSDIASLDDLFLRRMGAFRMTMNASTDVKSFFDVR